MTSVSPDTNGGASRPGPPTKRKRTYGTFVCDYEYCERVFTRADHLSRHKKNHDPSQKLPCTWPGCTVSFTRNDVREKHLQRHIARVEKQPSTGKESDDNSSSDKSNPSQNYPVSSEYTDRSAYPASSSSEAYTEQLRDNSLTEPAARKAQVEAESAAMVLARTYNSPHISRYVQTEVPSNPFHAQVQSPQSQLLINHLDSEHHKPLSPSDLIEWLFHDDSVAQGDKIPANEFHNFPNQVSPVSSLIENVFAVSPKFPPPSNRKSVDDATRHKLITLIPSLSLNQDFGIPQIERCLEVFWLIYHPQFPILHRPSFSNSEAHPLLLLSMIMMGASLSSCTGKPEPLFVAPQKLAEHIAEPLRWLIFSNADCNPPAKVYIVQSLLLLESFEITSTSRFLHERSFLYHGTKIQLLRRSPILGGDPLKKDVDDEDPHVWKQWIEFESMKRACLMAFYLDTVNSTVYGHTIILYAHQIKLSLPCEDTLWEYNNENSKIDSISNFQSPKFLDALKGLLHRQHVNTSKFGKSILLAGLLTIMFQMQQKDLQLSFLEWDSMKESWNEIISLAIDVWRVEVCPNGCFDTNTAFTFSESDVPNLPPSLRIEDTRCKFSLYHIAQIYMRITHYDYIVYAGAPSRMNVKVTDSEYRNAERRVKEWSSGINGQISVVHAYLFLCEMLLSPDNDDISYVYDPTTDPFLHRKNIIASAVLVIFAYNFSLDGPESNFFNSIRDDNFYPEKEDGYSYLRRIRKHFASFWGRPIHETSHIESSEYHSVIKKFAGHLHNIENKHHMAGLFKVFEKSFKNCNWEVGREYSKLFKNCIERCLGRKSITCVDMYSV